MQPEHDPERDPEQEGLDRIELSVRANLIGEFGHSYQSASALARYARDLAATRVRGGAFIVTGC